MWPWSGFPGGLHLVGGELRADGESGPLWLKCHLPSVLVGLLPRLSRVLVPLVFAALGILFPADVSARIFHLWTAWPHIPVEMSNQILTSPPNTRLRRSYSPIPPTPAGAWNGRELGFLWLAG